MVNLELRHAWVKGTQSKNRRPISVPLNDVALAVLKRQEGKRLIIESSPTWASRLAQPTRRHERLRSQGRALMTSAGTI
jgi:hypothetical protein